MHTFYQIYNEYGTQDRTDYFVIIIVKKIKYGYASKIAKSESQYIGETMK